MLEIASLSVRVAGRRVIEDIVTLVLTSQCSEGVFYSARGYPTLMLFYVVFPVALDCGLEMNVAWFLMRKLVLDPHRSRVSQSVRSEQSSFQQEQMSIKRRINSSRELHTYRIYLFQVRDILGELSGHEACGIELTKWSNR